MGQMSKVASREIIEDFAREITTHRLKGSKPELAVINYRNDKKNSFERIIYEVPIIFLRFRKDNGRIASEVLSFEKQYGPLDEKTDETQNILFGFLSKLDGKKNKELMQTLEQAGQEQPAIITSDGFLINGNRRKMAFHTIAEKRGVTPDSITMKVVILPGKNEEGGPPTLLDIEKIENRYQLQTEAKAEYYSFNRALSMRRKVELGMTLVDQLKDDPVYASLDEKEFNKMVKDHEKQFIEPLIVIDKYLEHLDRDELYDTISKGPSDKEGRWEAFLDYSNFYRKYLLDPKKRMSIGIEEDEIGLVEDVAFKIIRKRDLKETGLAKTHQAMRDLPKWLTNKDAKKELFVISKKVDLSVPEEHRLDKDGKELPPNEIDKIWGNLNKEVITHAVKKAQQIANYKKIKETPFALLQAALSKLNHDDMDLGMINVSELPKGLKLAEEIEKRASEIKKEIYDHKKNLVKLKNKGRA